MEQTTRIKGRIGRVFFSSDNFSAGVIYNDADPVGLGEKFRAKFGVEEGDEVELVGGYVEDPKFGRQFSADSYVPRVDFEADALAEFLAKSKDFAGVGTITAGKLVGATDGKLERLAEPEVQAELRSQKVSQRMIDDTLAQWIIRRDLGRQTVALTRYGVSIARATKLLKKFGSAVIKTVETNPYWLIGRVDGMAFKSVDRIALGVGVAKDDPNRIDACLDFVVANEAQNGGHILTTFNGVVDRAIDLLYLDDVNPELAVSKRLRLRFEDEESELTAIDDDKDSETLVGLAPYVDAERSSIGWLRAAATTGESASIGDAMLALDNVCDRLGGVKPNEEQAAAVFAALRQNVVVVTGGAGVGKTFTVGLIVNTLRDHVGRVRVSLCAPTGKAAKRITEEIRTQAGCEDLHGQTIHRLLEAQMMPTEDGETRFGFARDEQNKLDADIVIVDEFSMADSKLVWSLLRAIDPARTKVVLVGDPNQLPPVGAGSMLRDLIQHGDDRWSVPVVHLKHGFRQAGTLKTCVNATLDQHFPDTQGEDGAPPPRSGGIGPWYAFDGLADPSVIPGIIESIFTERLSKYRLPGGSEIDRLWDMQILAPMYKGPAGVHEINRRIQRIVQGNRGVVVETKMGKDGKPLPPRPLPGDKVICTKNLNEKIVNGSQGTVLRKAGRDETDAKSAWVVRFKGDNGDDFDAVITSTDWPSIQVCYAMTVHKSQGSQYPVVVVVCHSTHTVMLHRSLIYTAVSRASAACLTLGDRKGMNRAVNRVIVDDRRTLASEGVA